VVKSILLQRQEMGCDLGHGHLLARPQPVADVSSLLHTLSPTAERPHGPAGPAGPATWAMTLH